MALHLGLLLAGVVGILLVAYAVAFILPASAW